MENIIAERVKDTKLTKAQLKIAEYVIQNPERVGMTSWHFWYIKMVSMP